MAKITRTIIFCVCMVFSLLCPLLLLVVPHERSPQNCHNFGDFPNSPHNTNCEANFCFAACITKIHDNKQEVVKFGGRLCEYYEVRTFFPYFWTYFILF